MARKGEHMKHYNEELLALINKQEPTFLTRAAKKGYVCPACKSGSGHGDEKNDNYNRSYTGITRDPASGKFHCFACGRNFDVIDLYGETYGLTDFPEQVKQAAAYFGIDPDKFSQEDRPKERKKRPQPSGSEAPEADFTEYYRACVSRLNEPAAINYLTKRGISLNVAAAYWVGYDPAADPASVPGASAEDYKPHPAARIIIPTRRSHYIARAVDPETPKGYIKMNPSKEKGGGSVGIFNEPALYKQDVKTVFITEGAFDALSIIEAAGAEAISLNSTSNAKMLLRHLKEKPANVKFIIMLDSDEPGQRATAVLLEGVPAEKLEGLRELGYIAMAAECPANDPNEWLQADREGMKTDILSLLAQVEDIKPEPEAAECPAKDPNEWLQADREGMKTDILSLLAQVEDIKPEPEAPDGMQSAESLLTDYFAKIEEQPAGLEVKTGFPALDMESTNLYGGLHEGLYIIGALSSAGKTTFCLQMAEQIAEQGHEVIFFSLEQSAKELLAKQISRHTYINERATRENGQYVARTTWEVLNNRRYHTYGPKTKAAIKTAIDDSLTSAKHLHIYEGKYKEPGKKPVKMTMGHVKQILKNYCEPGNVENPVIFIDYLQLLEPEDGKITDAVKIVDSNVDELKQVSRLYGIPVFAISSYNRDSYKNGSVQGGAAMAAFRGSSMIEYSADILFSLQPHYLFYEKARIDETDQEKAVRLKNYKNGQKEYNAVLGDGAGAYPDTPAKVDLKCLKNRNGKKFSVGFNFIPAFNYYEQRYGDLETWKVNEREAAETWEAVKSSPFDTTKPMKII